MLHACDWIDSAIRAYRLPHNPQSNAVSVEDVRTLEFSHYIVWPQVVNAN